MSDGLAADIHTQVVARTLAGPRPPQNPLARLIASAQGEACSLAELADRPTPFQALLTQRTARKKAKDRLDFLGLFA